MSKRIVKTMVIIFLFLGLISFSNTYVFSATSTDTTGTVINNNIKVNPTNKEASGNTGENVATSFCTYLLHEQLEKVSINIANELTKHVKGKKVLITFNENFKTLASYQKIQKELDLTNKKINQGIIKADDELKPAIVDKVIKKGKATKNNSLIEDTEAAITKTSGIVSLIKELLDKVKGTTTYENVQLNINNTAIASSISNHLLISQNDKPTNDKPTNDKPTIYIEDLNYSTYDNSQIIKELNTLNDNIILGQNKITEIDKFLDRQNDYLASLSKDNKNNSEIIMVKNQSKKLTDCKRTLETIINANKDKTLNTDDLEKLLLLESLNTKVKNVDFILYLNPVAVSGSILNYSSSLNIGTKSYSAGLVVDYILLHATNGNVIASNNKSAMSDYKRPKDIQKEQK